MNDHLPKIEGEAYAYKAFPAVCRSPEGKTDVFNTEAEVPAGWTMPDGKVKGGKAKTAETPAPVATTPATETPAVVSDEVDAAGTPWNAELHRPTKSKNKAGLWHMKVGVSRPEPLDL